MTSFRFLPPAAGTLGRLLAMAALGLPTGAAAQTFSGSDAGATPIFILTSGPTSVTIEASDQGFAALLLATDGSVVTRLSATGHQEFRVPEDGRYLFDVRASGPWRISFEAADSTRILALQGRIEGAQAAGGSPPAAWLGKGFGAGLILGPIGTLFVTQRASRADVSPDAALEARLAGESPAYATAFRESYMEQLRGNQRTAALVGGLTGTAILSFAILQLTVWGEEPGAPGGEGGGGENVAIITVGSFPLPW